MLNYISEDKSQALWTFSFLERKQNSCLANRRELLEVNIWELKMINSKVSRSFCLWGYSEKWQESDGHSVFSSISGRNGLFPAKEISKAPPLVDRLKRECWSHRENTVNENRQSCHVKEKKTNSHTWHSHPLSLVTQAHSTWPRELEENKGCRRKQTRLCCVHKRKTCGK